MTIIFYAWFAPYFEEFLESMVEGGYNT